MDEARDLTKQLLEHGAFVDGLSLSAKIGPDAMDQLFDAAISYQGERTPHLIDALFLGELQLIAGHADSAEAVIRSSMQRWEPRCPYYKSLGWCLLSQGKSDDARQAFQAALKDRRKRDNTFDLEQADPDQMTAAYFLDLISEQRYVQHFQDNETFACFPWFYVAQRCEIEGKPEAATKAYESCLGAGHKRDFVRILALAEWRLGKLRKELQERQK